MRLSIILLLFLLSSCGFQKKNSSDKCKTFFNLVKTDWIEKEPHLFGWKGDPEYWNANKHGDKYLPSGCIEGLSKKEIVKLFGKATKEFNAVNYSVWTYCMQKTEACFSQETNSDRELNIIFKNEVVSNAYTSPMIGYSFGVMEINMENKNLNKAK